MLSLQIIQLAPSSRVNIQPRKRFVVKDDYQAISYLRKKSRTKVVKKWRISRCNYVYCVQLFALYFFTTIVL